MTLDKSPAQFSPWPLILLMLAGAGGYFSLSSRLESSRPRATHDYEQPTLWDEDVPSRLWQDPFKAVSEHLRTHSDTKGEEEGDATQNSHRGEARSHTTKMVKKRIEGRVKELRQSPDPGSPKVLILPVMVAGAPYAGDEERRLRARYAVVTALITKGYVPEDGKHIGHFEMAWPSANEPADPGYPEYWCDQDTADTDRLVVPFEWFVRDSLRDWDAAKSASSVLVLWLADEPFGHSPLKRLELLRKCLLDGESAPTDSSHVRFEIIGPASSTTYGEMQRGDAKPWCTVYSPWSTMPDPLLARGSSDNDAVLHALKKRTDYVRTIHMDDQLMLRLVDELKRRGVRVSGENDTDLIALISESDTHYGRAMPLTFAAALAYDASGERPRNDPQETISTKYFSNVIANPDAWPRGLVRLSYLRGVDGQVPRQPGEKSKSDSEPKESDDAQQVRPAVGPGQYDYVRRLSKTLTQLTQVEEEESKVLSLELQRKGRLTAIGILGSDVYDKLLLLQALRRRFPNALFFTTDLDARFLHPDELPYTRNLIVASQYGPEPLENALPFRDTYQAAIFRACVAAISGHNQLTLPYSRLFEVGRNGIVDLDDGALPRFGWSVRLSLLLLAILLFIFLKPVIEQMRELESGSERLETWQRRTMWSLVGLAVLGVIGFLAIALVDQRSPDREPFSIIDGVSIWPTEALRLVAAWLAVFFMVKGGFGLWRSRETLTAEFFPKGFVPSKLDEPRVNWDLRPALLAERLRRFRRLISVGGWNEEGRSIDPHKVWGTYLMLGRPKHRLRRFVPHAVLYLASGFLLIGVLEAVFGHLHTPYRGNTSWFVDKFALSVSVVLLVFLIFYVVDATRLCAQFIRNLSVAPTGWPQAWTKHSTDESSSRLADWLDIQLIAKRTRAVGRLLVYPFIVIFFMLVARSNYFDNWGFPIPIVTIIGISMLVALACAVALGRAARLARQRALHRLRNELSLCVRNGKGREPEGELLRLAIQEIDGLREGAFAPLTQQPIVQALLLPTGGLGGWALVRQFLLPG